MDFNFQNITIEKIVKDGEVTRFEARPNNGYVMHDPNENDVEFDENGKSNSVSYYRTIAGFPKNYNFANFPYVAVLRSTVDETYIF